MNFTSTEALLDWFDRSDGVTTDTRRCGPGKLFFALKGERFDGNAFAREALAAGCLGAVVDDPALSGDRLLHVEDVLTALQDLAHRHRTRFPGPVFGLTGSNGKTTTKELLRAVLSKSFDVHATEGNLNNHIGVPLTLLSMPADVEFALVEMGANHQGEIALLSRIADPTHGMITNVGLAHLEGFGGVDGVKKGKQELYLHLASRGGTALVPADDPDLMALSTLDGLTRNLYRTEDHPPLLWRDGDAPDAPLYWSLDGTRTPGPWHVEGTPLPVQLEGPHQVANMAAAVAAGLHFGVQEADICAALATFEPVRQRGETVETGRNTVIVDCYNANPSSVESTLRAFAAAGHGAPLAILGDMMELGAHSAEGHRLARGVARECGLECWV
ncbi:MAG: UDP-N-acetylmuramoyl-tripeptide--D-alanyl-D-alanine ligase, partial [Bacteroidota bacterium]|nr:UDP-N-acetylmuramoyl-tripeptide--D-alanyl-D-alanine ligase [Bacteroidota bacterium]